MALVSSPLPGLSQISTLTRMLTMGGEISASKVAERADDILNAIVEKLKRQSKDDFKGRYFEAWLIVQAVA